VEAQNLQQFQRDFANEANVRFPSPIFPWVRPAVLVESFEEGIKMTHLLDQVASKSLPWWLDQALCAKIPQIGIKAFFSMVFKFHLVHADLHPGNILVRFPRREAELSAKLSRCPQQDFQINSRAVSRSDSEPHLQTPLPAQQLDTVNLDSLQEVELVFMDAGLVARLDSDQRKNFVDLFEALAGCNGHQAAEMMIARSPQAVLPPLEDQEMFKLEMDRIVRENLWGGKTTFQLNKVNFAGILIECATLSRKYHVQLDAAYASVMVGALVMEGMGRQLNADLNLFDIARPILLENYKSIFSLVSWSERLSTTKLFISDFWTNLRGESV
jgi:aarF domain-containing kinase